LQKHILAYSDQVYQILDLTAKHKSWRDGIRIHLCPQQTWDCTWTDEELYKKYGITADE